MSKQVLIIGAGYAGLTTAIRLSRSGMKVRLVDRGSSFLDLIRLHKTIHTPLKKFQMPLGELAGRFGFEFKQARVDPAAFDLVKAAGAGRIATSAGELAFDALAIATGAEGLPRLEARVDPAALGRTVLSLNTLRERDGNAAIKDFLKNTETLGPEGPTVTFVGGGATALQFLFEFKDFMQGMRRPCRLRLIDLEDRLLGRFPPRFSQYAAEKIEKGGIEYLPGTKFLSSEGERVECEDGAGNTLTLDSQLTFLFPGVQPAPELHTDPFGRVRIHHEATGQEAPKPGAAMDGLEYPASPGTPERRVLPNVFAAGDCSVFAGGGLNAWTAQAAVRKGRRIAINIENAQAGRTLEPYSFRELGYFVSMGFWDGIGYMLADGNVLTGVPAFAVKEAIEQQFALFAKGFDTYSIVEGIPGLG